MNYLIDISKKTSEKKLFSLFKKHLKKFELKNFYENDEYKEIIVEHRDVRVLIKKPKNINNETFNGCVNILLDFQISNDELENIFNQFYETKITEFNNGS